VPLKPDCFHFKGDKPCVFGSRCEGCLHFEPLPPRILVIKCRAQGDVLRTTALLPALKRKFPRSFIAWLVDGESKDLLQNNPYIDRLLAFDLEDILPLLIEQFDVLISLDKEPGPAALAARVRAHQKLGFGLNDLGNLLIFNRASEYAYRLGVDNELKFRRNAKTYQEIIHEIAEVPYARDEYVFCLPDRAKGKAERFFKRHRISGRRPSVGLNTGAGTKFETKQWPREHFQKLISLLTGKLGANVFLLGGPRERQLNLSLERNSPARVYNTGADNPLLEFAGYISKMNLVVCSDTLGMHLAVALKKRVVALFGPTCPQEIDLYGRGTKLFTGASCAPCYLQTCPDGKCMREITPENVFREIQKLL
jgi:ADP-heptose:LPS heptosyltransferase